MTAVYPGSFDPPTLGHIDVIERAAKIFGGLCVVVANSSRKDALFSASERKVLLEKSVKHLKNVVVDIHDGLTVDYMKKIKSRVIIRGLRAVSDFEYELAMATMNRKLYPKIETFIMMTGENYYYIASHTVKEVALHGGDVSQLVPKPVVDALKKKLHKKR
ncbi:MAG: pantetheine-phosphate adenylyltransferase [Oligoflexia bacterium]|nr:pantetheine-phosphate adenylyltransferase [Oligoflexia bacterium]